MQFHEKLLVCVQVRMEASMIDFYIWYLFTMSVQTFDCTQYLRQTSKNKQHNKWFRMQALALFAHITISIGITFVASVSAFFFLFCNDRESWMTNEKP